MEMKMEKERGIIREMIEELNSSPEAKDRERATALRTLLDGGGAAKDNQLSLKTKHGELFVDVSKDNLYPEVYIDFIREDGFAFPISCTSYEVEVSDVVTKLWKDSDDQDSQFRHNIEDRYQIFLSQEIGHILDDYDVNLVEVGINASDILEMGRHAARKLKAAGGELSVEDVCFRVIEARIGKIA